MLSYRHAFHAGNFADVFKHIVLVQLIEFLQKKETPFCYLETHSGAALYDLSEPAAQKNREFDHGICQLLKHGKAHADWQRYLDIIQSFNQQPESDRCLQYYPGSPRIAHALLRPQDAMVLCEKHPTDAQLLKKEFARESNTAVHEQDGYLGLKGFLPPKQKRGLILIDPAYELKDEVTRLSQALGIALQRFRQGVYAIWYPLMAGQGQSPLERAIKNLPVEKALCVEIRVKGQEAESGMVGSGLIIINPPWQLDVTLERFMPELTLCLQQSTGASYRVCWLVDDKV